MSYVVLTRPSTWTLRSKLVAGMLALFGVVMPATGALTVLATRQYLTTQLSNELLNASQRVGGFNPRPDREADGAPAGLPGSNGSSVLVLGLVNGSVAVLADGTALNHVVNESNTDVALDSSQVAELQAAQLGAQPKRVNIGGDVGSYLLIARQAPNGVVYITGVPTKGVDDTVANLLDPGRRRHHPRARRRVRRRNVPRPPQPRAAVPGGRHRATGVPAQARLGRRRRGGPGARVGHRPAHRGGPGRARAQQHARQRRGGSPVPARERDAGAPVRRGRLPRAADAARLDPGVRRAVPPREGAGAGVGHPCHRAASSPSPCGCRSSSRTCSCSLGSTPAARSSASRSTSRLLAMDAVSDAHAASPDHRWELDLPEDPVEVPGDQARLHQILANLLANARTHTPSGTTVVTRLRHEGGWVRLSVEDDGPGIPESLQRNVFQTVHPWRGVPLPRRRLDRPRPLDRRRRRPGPRGPGRARQPPRRHDVLGPASRDLAERRERTRPSRPVRSEGSAVRHEIDPRAGPPVPLGGAHEPHPLVEPVRRAHPRRARQDERGIALVAGEVDAGPGEPLPSPRPARKERRRASGSPPRRRPTPR